MAFFIFHFLLFIDALWMVETSFGFSPLLVDTRSHRNSHPTILLRNSASSSNNNNNNNNNDDDDYHNNNDPDMDHDDEYLAFMEDLRKAKVEKLGAPIRIEEEVTKSSEHEFLAAMAELQQELNQIKQQNDTNNKKEVVNYLLEKIRKEEKEEEEKEEKEGKTAEKGEWE